MNKRSYKKIGACLLLLVVFSVIFNTNTVKSEAVTPSTVNYRVVLKNNIHTFIHNAKSIGSAENTEYYMTYTVKNVTSVGTQHGVLGTDNFLQSCGSVKCIVKKRLPSN